MAHRSLNLSSLIEKQDLTFVLGFALMLFGL